MVFDLCEICSGRPLVASPGQPFHQHPSAASGHQDDMGQDPQRLCKGSSQEGQGSESSGQGRGPCKSWAETQEALHRHPEVQVPGGALAVPAASKGRRLRAKALQGGSDGCQEPVSCSGRWVGEWPWALGLNKAGCAAGRVQQACPVIGQGPGPRSSCMPTPRNKRAAWRMYFLRNISSQSGTDAPAASRTLRGLRAGHRFPAPSEAGPRLRAETTPAPKCLQKWP